MTQPTEEIVDAGARYLRETLQAGKRLTPWADTPNATKKKWLALSKGMLLAAMPSPDAEAMRWQPIETAPIWEEDVLVLVCGGRFEQPTNVRSDGEYWRADGLTNVKPTHWMPLPLTPDAAR